MPDYVNNLYPLQMFFVLVHHIFCLKNYKFYFISGFFLAMMCQPLFKVSLKQDKRPFRRGLSKVSRTNFVYVKGLIRFSFVFVRHHVICIIFRLRSRKVKGKELMKLYAEYKELLAEAKLHEVENHDVIICTCVTAASKIGVVAHVCVCEVVCIG